MTFNLKTTMRAIASAVLSVVAFAAVAASTEPAVVIYYDNTGKSEEVIFLSDTPRITYAGSQVKIVAESCTVERNMSDISKVTIEERSMAGVTETTANSVQFSFIGNEIKCHGLQSGSAVNLYNANGTSVLSATADSNGAFATDISALAPGIYVLSISNNNSYKIYKK